MNKAEGRLTVYFENPFWVGVFERVWEGKLTACKVTFGAEPKDWEIYEFILKSYDRLPFSPAVEAGESRTIRNPKRARREAGREIAKAGTKSQQALQLQREQMKTERRELSREQREEEKARRFRIKSRKRKEKHKGK